LVEVFWSLDFVVRSCTRDDVVPILVKQKLRKSQRRRKTEQGKKPKMVGRKDSETPTWRKKLQQNKNKKSCEVPNPEIPVGLYRWHEYDCKGLIGWILG
jgi:hypothetical protein